MFGLPNAKRVKRSKLFAASSSSEDEHENISEAEGTQTSGRKPRDDTNIDQDREAIDERRIDYGFEYEYIDKSLELTSTSPRNPASKDPTANPDADEQAVDVEAEAEAETYTFNLFAPKPTHPTDTTTTTTTTAQEQAKTKQPHHTTQSQITLRPPTPPQHSLLLDLQTLSQKGHILSPRPLSHYLTSHQPTTLLKTLKTQCTAAAISGPTLLSTCTTQSWPGTHLPWRVIHVPRSKLTLVTTPVPTPTRPIETKTRPRPSKKRRIQIRQRRQAREAAREAGVAAEQAEREKRTRRNREKKVRRKVREKAKKAGEREKEGMGVDGDGGGTDVEME